MNDELTPDERAALRARIVGGARGITPAGAHRGAWIAGSIAAVLVVAIAGGVVATSTLSAPPVATTPSPTPTVTADPSPTPTATPTPSATPTSAARVVTPPASRFSFGCDEIAQTVQEFFDGEVPETALAMPRTRGNSWVPGPVQYAFAQAGAVYCEFGDVDGTWLTVAVVADAQGAIEDRNSFAGGGCDPQYPPCELVSGSFILVEGAYAGLPGDAATPAIDAAWGKMRDLVLASPPAPSSWTPPTGTTPLTGDCASFLPPDRLSAILGNDGMIVEPQGRGGWSLWYWMMSDYWTAEPCLARSGSISSYEDPSGMMLVWLPGGEWAFDEAATGQPLPFDGGREPDRAFFSCEPIDQREGCRADLLIDGNWIRFSLPELVSSGDGIPVASEVATTIAEAVYG